MDSGICFGLLLNTIFGVSLRRYQQLPRYKFFVLEEIIIKACVKRSQFHLNWIKISSPKQVQDTIWCNTRQVSPAATKCPKVQRYWPRPPVFFLLSHRGRRARVKGKELSLLPSNGDLARAKRAKLSTMGNNTGYLSIQIIWVLTKSSVRPSVRLNVRPPLHAGVFRMP